MSGQGRTLLALGCVLAAGIAAAIFLVLDDGPAADVAGGAAATADAPKETVAATKPAGGQRRSTKKGTASVVGEVRRSKGQTPVADQEVLLVPERGDPWSVRTDAAGAFLLAEIPHGGPYEVRVAAPGCGTIRIPGIALDRNEKRELGTLWLDPAVKVTAEVRGWADQPIAGASVEAFAVAQADNFDWSKAFAQMGQAPVPVAKASTDAKGIAVFPELATGRWTFTATKEGWSRAGRTNVAVRADVDPAPVKLYLGTGHALSGRVTDATKAPVAGAVVMAGPMSNGWDLGSTPLRSRTTTDAEGRYALASLESGDASVWIGRAGAIPAMVATLRIPGVTKFDWTLKGTATITGTVTSKDGGAPVDAATVRAWSWAVGSQGMAEATTDAKGRYVLAVGEGLVNSIIADKEGWVSGADPGKQQAQLQMREGETQTRDLVLRPASKLSGVVRGPQGPLAAVKVVVQSGSPYSGWSQKQATTDAGGRYEVTSITPGNAVVRAELAGWYVKDFPDNYWQLMQQSGPSPFKVEVPAGGVATKDVDMVQGVAVEGRVDGPDGPLAGARVGPQDREGGVTTDGNGAFRVEGVKPSPNVWLMLTKDGYVPSSANKPFAVSADQPTTGIVLRMSRTAVVKGTVTASDGTPVVDGRVSVTAFAEGMEGRAYQMESSMGRGFGGQAGAWAPVRPDGTYEAVLTGGTGKFRVNATALDRPGASSEQQPIVDGQMEYVVNLTMESGRGLEGEVVAKPGGAAVPGALVTVQMRSKGGADKGLMPAGMVYGGEGSGQQTVWAVADAAGHFAVGHLVPGTYAVTARADEFVAGSATVDLAATANVKVEIETELAIEGAVTMSDGAPVAGANVNAMREEPGERPGAGPKVSPGGWTVTGADGRFRIPGLASGGYRLRVSPDWQGEANIKVKSTDLVQAGARDVKVLVESGGVIAGRVLDPQRKGVANVGVNANPEPKEGRPLEGNEGRGTRTREDGSFTLAGLGDATFNLVVQMNQPWDSGSSSPYRNALVKGVSVGTSNVEIVLEEGLTITGVLVGADAKPMPSASLSCKGATREPNKPYDNPRNALTDPNGAFSIVGLAPGDFSIMLQDPALVIENGDKVPAGAHDVRLVATRGIVLTGAVVNESGAPVKNANVNAVPKGGGRSRGARVKDDGTFEIAGLPTATAYKVTANASGRPASSMDDVPPGAGGVRLVLLRGVDVAGKVFDENGNPLAQCRVSFKLQGDSDTRAMAMTDGDGAFKSSGFLEGGVYEAEAMVMSTTNSGRGFTSKKCGTFKAGAGPVELKVQP